MYATIVTMKNLIITRNGKYDIKANINLKVRARLPKIIDVVDNFFVNH